MSTSTRKMDHLDPSASPARLALAARLHGGPAGGEGARRVLEIGCGRGDNLLALAFYDPEGSYLGIDGDPASIDVARAAAAEIGLENARFEVVSRDEPPADLGTFDVVLGRDALARATEPARTEVLRVCRESLSETGILVLDYPVLPGATNRALVRSLIGPQIDDAAAPDARIAQARAPAEAIRGMLAPSSHPYPQLLALELSRVVEAPAAVVRRDYLDAPAVAFAHRDVVHLAASHGLRFVCDAAWNRPEGFTAPEIVEELSQRGLKGADLDQALDVMRCRFARSSVFCHVHQPERDRPGPELLDELWIASPLAPKTEGVRLTPGAEEPFVGPAGERIGSSDPLLKAVLLELHAAWPRSRRFADLVSAAVGRLHEAGADGEPSDAQLAGVAQDLWELFRRGLVDLLPTEPRFEAGHTLHALARYQARTGSALTSPLHTSIPLDTFDAALVTHMDPGADEDTLVGAMLVEAARGGVAIEIGGSRLTDPTLLEPMIRGLVRRGVATLTRWGLVD